MVKMDTETTVLFDIQRRRMLRRDKPLPALSNREIEILRKFSFAEGVSRMFPIQKNSVAS